MFATRFDCLLKLYWNSPLQGLFFWHSNFNPLPAALQMDKYKAWSKRVKLPENCSSDVKEAIFTTLVSYNSCFILVNNNKKYIHWKVKNSQQIPTVERNCFFPVFTIRRKFELFPFKMVLTPQNALLRFQQCWGVWRSWNSPP